MDVALMITSLPKLLNAAVVTLKLLSLSLFFGLFIGLIFAILRLNKNPIINKFAYSYSYVFRGTPLLVQIFIIYFGLGQIEYFRSTFLWVVFITSQHAAPKCAILSVLPVPGMRPGLKSALKTGDRSSASAAQDRPHSSHH